MNKGDELLLINGKSIVGFRVADVVKLLKAADSPVKIIVATSKVCSFVEKINDNCLLLSFSQLRMSCLVDYRLCLWNQTQR